MPIKLELLSPARNAQTARAAILAGADAVYIGAPAFGARAAAGNDIDSIASLTAFAHKFRAKVYVTMNTILYPDELERARKMVWDLYAASVDALIVQDMAYLMMELPPIALHASTQCDIRTAQKAQILALAGFSQLVLPREFGFDQIKECAHAAGVPVEVFVHGALCVSYSGDCQAGLAATGRSANRGECPQICRLPFDLTDADGNAVAPRKHYLSLRDMQRIDRLSDLIDAGAISFKIEGRLKDSRYVTNVTAAYSQALDRIIAASNGRYCRASAGRVICNFTPDTERTFNRRYTDYFLSEPTRGMASLDTPKWAGTAVGRVLKPFNRRTRSFSAKLSKELANGDGLGFFDAAGDFHGFRLNRIDGGTLYPASEPKGLTPGTPVYRNADKVFADILDRADACRRVIDVDLRLSALPQGNLMLDAHDSRGCCATLIFESPVETSQKADQTIHRRDILSKTGGSIYNIESIDDSIGSRFVPASILSRARRQILSLLDINAESTYVYDRRRPCALPHDAFASLPPLTRHDNVSNPLSEEFYRRHGARIDAMAAETDGFEKGENIVMTTRYCIRRELGACLRTPDGHKLPSQLFLRNDSGVYRLDFDCKKCGMKVVRQ